MKIAPSKIPLYAGFQFVFKKNEIGIIKQSIFKHKAILYNEAERLSLPFTNLNEMISLAGN